MKVSVNSERCIGCELCSVICPDIFKVNNSATVTTNAIPVDVEEDVREAVECCPVEAITIE